MNIEDTKPVFGTIEKTEKLVASQEYSFDENHSFDEAGVIFGGLYGNESVAPGFDYVSDMKPVEHDFVTAKPTMNYIEETEQQVTGDWTFNQTGVTFNSVGTVFGGVYGPNGMAPVLEGVFAPIWG